MEHSPFSHPVTRSTTYMLLASGSNLVFADAPEQKRLTRNFSAFEALPWQATKEAAHCYQTEGIRLPKAIRLKL